MKEPQLQDRTVRIIGLPFVTMLVPFILHPHEFLKFGPFFQIGVILSFITTVLLWEGDRQFFIIARRRYPFFDQTSKRLIFQALAVLAYTLLISLVLHYCIYEQIFQLKGSMNWLTELQVNLIPTIIITLCYESVYFFQLWKENLKKAEMLARVSLESQLALLKSQLDPHFLFNSLNTLASMIDDNEPASTYLEQLSDVYRYVLINREKNLVSLEEEIHFLDAYIYLNKTRFRENLQIEKTIDPAALGRRIAPLSLQLLVENAIKHNIISKDKPLLIRIGEEQPDYLVVENDVQTKTILESSTRIGLQNLKARYELLTSRQIEIVRDAAQFKVRIPLLPAFQV